VRESGFRMARKNNSAFFAFWSVAVPMARPPGGTYWGDTFATGGGLLPYFPESLIRFQDSLFGLVPAARQLFLIRGIREESGLPVRKFVEVLRSIVWNIAWTYHGHTHYDSFYCFHRF